MTSRSEMLRICASCGIIAPTERAACRDCDAPFDAGATTVARLAGDGAFWVGVRAQIVCKVCGKRSPLSHLDADGAVLCERCGIDQAFDRDQWQRALAHAHAVGDLAGPAPAGRVPDGDPSIAGANPFAAIGKKDTWSHQGSKEMVTLGDPRNQSLSIRAAPGHPLCRACRAPLALASRSDTTITVRCEPCATTATYETPKAVRKRIAGVVAAGQANGERDVVLDENASGAVAIRCPECNAALDAGGVDTVVRCPYCHVSSRIAPATPRRLGGSEREAATFWVLFEGPSQERGRLETKARQHAAKQERAAARAREKEAAGRSSRGEAGRKKPAAIPPELRRFGVAILIGAAMLLYLWWRSQ